MHIRWWKYLAVIILIYTFIGGMLIPLGPGVSSSELAQSETGKHLDLQIKTYNIPQYTGLEGYLRLDSFLLKANDIRVKNSATNTLVLGFDLPPYLPVKDTQVDASLIVFQPESGSAILPTAVFLKQSEVNVKAGRASWSRDDVLAGKDLVGGFHFPYRSILYETIRNTYFHVPMWFAMITMFTISGVMSILYLMKGKTTYDLSILNFNRTGVLFGLLGLTTGMIWARYTWGEFWSSDIKQNMAAICLLIYGGYFVLRATVDDIDKKRRITAVFNIFAYIAMIPLLFVIPRMTDSLHPGSGGNPAMGGQDLDNTMRMIFYPAIIGWILMGLWISEVGKRYSHVKTRFLTQLYENKEKH